jgi:hypothetical protein
MCMFIYMCVCVCVMFSHLKFKVHHVFLRYMKNISIWKYPVTDCNNFRIISKYEF